MEKNPVCTILLGINKIITRPIYPSLLDFHNIIYILNVSLYKNYILIKVITIYNFKLQI